MKYSIKQVNFSMEPGERLRILFQKGTQVDVQNNVPIRRYFRSCQELIRMAGVYYDEGNYETSYLYYAKFIVLLFEKLKTHPGYSNAAAAEKAANRQSLKNVAFPRAEKLKVLLRKKYEEEYEKYKIEQEEAAKVARRKEEEMRLEKEKRIKEEEEQKLKNETEKTQHERDEMDAFLKERRRKEIEMERLAIVEQYGEKKPKPSENQPLVPVEFAPPPTSLPPSVSSAVNLPPSRPPVHPSQHPSSTAPAHNTSKPGTDGPFVPSFDRSLKPSTTPYHAPNNDDNNVINQMSTAFAASLTLSENKYGLRTILSPSELPSKFMKVAHSNTVKNIETCGVLFGKLANEVFVITHVLVPHQKGASDSCDTTREEDMWDFQDQYNGICLGWIHTHPSQTAFLSSVDLHTHYPYQCLMPESVAIVCSGKFNEVGNFMLTPDHGMGTIGGCQQKGFHPHPTNPALFESCDHVKPSPSHAVQIIDWRGK